MLCKIVFPLRCKFTIPNSALASCLSDAMHGADMPGQISTGSERLRASLTLEGSRVSLFVLSVIDQPCLPSKREREKERTDVYLRRSRKVFEQIAHENSSCAAISFSSLSVDNTELRMYRHV
jgi:hypothetical protein